MIPFVIFMLTKQFVSWKKGPCVVRKKIKWNSRLSSEMFKHPKSPALGFFFSLCNGAMKNIIEWTTKECPSCAILQQKLSIPDNGNEWKSTETRIRLYLHTDLFQIKFNISSFCSLNFSCSGTADQKVSNQPEFSPCNFHSFVNVVAWVCWRGGWDSLEQSLYFLKIHNVILFPFPLFE